MEARKLLERRRRSERLFLWVMGGVLVVLLWQSYGVLLMGDNHG